MGFQTAVNTVPAVGVAGDFASSNPRAATIAGPGGLVSGSEGVTVGRFAWIDPGDLSTVHNYSSGINSLPSGFVHRQQQASITNLLSESSMVILGGQQMGLMASGDYWVKNDGAAQAVPGQKAYADLTTGKVTFAATASASSASATGSIAAGTASATGSITDNVMTLTAALSGAFQVGCPLSGTNVATGTKVVRQLTGVAGGLGTYEVTPGEQTVAATTITCAYGTFTAASGLSGTFQVGGLLSGTNVVAGTAITAFGTGTGGLGTYIVNNNTVVSSTAITATTNVETKYICQTFALPGELAKITSVSPA
jgi:hypothetical protein